MTRHFQLQFLAVLFLLVVGVTPEATAIQIDPGESFRLNCLKVPGSSSGRNNSDKRYQRSLPVPTSTCRLEFSEKPCSNDVSAAMGNAVVLTFPTTKEDSIQLEHRSVGQDHHESVYFAGRLTNDYARSKRFNFSATKESWSLVIKNVSATDAGSFICTEDNGLGTQYVKDLVVIDANGAVCSTSNETYNNEVNVTCAANYSGYCSPRLQLIFAGNMQCLNTTQFITANTISLTKLVNGPAVAFCHLANQSLVFNSTCKVPGNRHEETNTANISKPIAIVLVVFISAAILIFFIIFLQRKK